MKLLAGRNHFARWFYAFYWGNSGRQKVCLALLPISNRIGTAGAVVLAEVVLADQVVSVKQVMFDRQRGCEYGWAKTRHEFTNQRGTHAVSIVCPA